MQRARVALVALALTGVGLAVPAPPAVAAGTWRWPAVGPVLRGFGAPEHPYGSGHRGIDIGASAGTVLVAPAAGTVRFAGPVGGRLFLTIEHAPGLRSTLSFLAAVSVRAGDVVVPGQPVAVSGRGHPDATVDHVHLGVRVGDTYVDPLTFLEPLDLRGLLRLAPWDPG